MDSSMGSFGPIWDTKKDVQNLAATCGFSEFLCLSSWWSLTLGQAPTELQQTSWEGRIQDKYFSTWIGFFEYPPKKCVIIWVSFSFSETPHPQVGFPFGVPNNKKRVPSKKDRPKALAFDFCHGTLNKTSVAQKDILGKIRILLGSMLHSRWKHGTRTTTIA